MSYPLNFIRKFYWPPICVAFFLTFLGLLVLYSLSSFHHSLFSKQLAFWLVGVGVMVALSSLNVQLLKEERWVIIFAYLVSLFAIAGLLLIGTKIRGTKKWYQWGEFTFDPAQVLKLVMVFIFAKCFATGRGFVQPSNIIKTVFYLIVPVFLILLQPDFGSAVVLGGILGGLLFLRGLTRRQIAISIFIIAIIFLIIWHGFLVPYQKSRLFSFLNQEFDPQGRGYTLRQSLIAVGSGGMTGKGLFSGSQSQLGFLPEPETDFIVSALAEQGGFLAILLLLVLWAGLIFFIIRVALMSQERFGFYLCFGIAIWIFSQGLINIAAIVGLVPIIGLSFPFLSYGGSSLISLYAALGLVESVWIRS